MLALEEGGGGAIVGFDGSFTSSIGSLSSEEETGSFSLSQPFQHLLFLFFPSLYPLCS